MVLNQGKGTLIEWPKLLPLLLLNKTLNKNPIFLKQIHSLFLTTSLALHSHPFSLLLHSFSYINSSYSLSLLLHSPLPPSTFLSNTLISSFSSSGRLPLALSLLSSFPPNPHSYPSILKACSFTPRFLPVGFALHARLLKTLPPPLDPVLLTSLILLHSRLPGPSPASLSLFDQIPCPDLPSWNAALRSAPPRDVPPLFRRLQLSSHQPNQITILSLVLACARLGSLAIGFWAHAYLLRRKLGMNCFLGSAFIHMYSKLGRLDIARQVFVDMPERDVCCYNALMGGFAANGDGDGALGLFEEIVREGIGPDEVSFLMVLTACSHAGMVEEGRRCFDRMEGEFGVSPRLEHYGCLVGILGRAGKVEEAEEIVRGMPMEPNGILFRALLGGFGRYKDEILMRKLVELEPDYGGNYVLLSNICADLGKWDGAVLWRKEMRERGIGKNPGLSFVEVDGVVEEFSIGDQTHPKVREIYEMIGLISGRFLS